MHNKLVDTDLNISQKGRAQKFWQYKPIKTKHSKESEKYENVDLREILKDYKLRGFEFGNWLSNSERYDNVLACESALNDLKRILGTNNIGLDNMVGIAFGARGMNKALAHYESTMNMINLTKQRGAGSLAHEYGHAIDWNFGRYVDQNKHYNWLSGGHSISKKLDDNTGGQFRYYVNLIVDAIKGTISYAKIEQAGEYWQRRNEVFARGFEQYICYRLRKLGTNNQYLTKSWFTYTNNNAYLSEKSFESVAPYFDKLVEEFKKYANGKSKVVAMPYHREDFTPVKIKLAANKVAQPAAKKAAKAKKAVKKQCKK